MLFDTVSPNAGLFDSNGVLTQFGALYVRDFRN
jgi:hypothetical protein